MKTYVTISGTGLVMGEKWVGVKTEPPPCGEVRWTLKVSPVGVVIANRTEKAK